MGPCFDAAFKLRVVAYYKQIRNKNRAAQMFGVSECSVRRWIKDDPKLRAAGPQARRRRLGDGRDGSARALLESGLRRFVERCQRRGARARYADLVAHAKQLKKVHKVRGVQISLDWVKDFVRRERLVTRCQKLKSAPGDDDGRPRGAEKGKAAANAAAQKGGPRGRAKGLSRAGNSVKAAAAKFLKRAKTLQAGKSPAAKAKAASSGKVGAKVKGKVWKKLDRKRGSDDKKGTPARRGPTGPKKGVAAKKAPAVKTAKNAPVAKKTATGKKTLSAKKALTTLKVLASRKVLASKKMLGSKKTLAAKKVSAIKKSLAVKKVPKILVKAAKPTPVSSKKGARMEKRTPKKSPKKLIGKLGHKLKGTARQPAAKRAGPTKKGKNEAKKRPKLIKASQQLVKVVNGTQRRAKQIVDRAKKSMHETKVKVAAGRTRAKSPLKRLRHRRAPTKVFRTRYRIKEMHRRIEENRTSDFFDFFYGLGLIPVNRSRDDSLCVPLMSGTPKYYDNPGFVCDITASPMKSSATVSGVDLPYKPSTDTRYPISAPMSRSADLQGSTSPSRGTRSRKQENHIIRDFSPCGKFGQSKLPEDKPESFFEKLHHASLQSEKALSPGESPITPEQLAVVKKLFPPFGHLKFPSHCSTTMLLKSPTATHTKSSPPKMDADRPTLRPRTSEQIERLSKCVKNRLYRKRKRNLSEPSESTSSAGPFASDIDWLSADGFSSSAKKMCPSPLYHIQDAGPCFRKEHFEESVDIGQDLSSAVNCHQSKASRTLTSAVEACSASAGGTVVQDNAKQRSNNRRVGFGSPEVAKALARSPNARKKDKPDNC